MEKIKVKVDNITVGEFAEANRIVFLRTYIPFSLLSVFFAIIYTGSIGQIRPLAVLVPVIVVIFLPLGSEYINRRDYKRYPIAQMEMEYTFDAIGWTMQMGEVKGGCRWFDAAKMKETRDLLLLYSTKRNSDMVPKRCLTEEQLEKIREFYRRGKR